jgi:hypothetical protein
MNATNANALIAAQRRLLPWAAVVLSIVAGFATGLWTAKSISLEAIGPDKAVAAKVNPPVADAAAQTFPIVPSPVIEPRPQFFYGTGDGNGGYYQAP